jgi:hypothetical protein
MMTQPDRFDLETLFAAARAAPPQMPDALAARIVADARTHLPRRPLWRRMVEAVGGPAGLGGLVTATVAGFWLGVAPPAETVDPLVLFGAAETVAEVEISVFDWTADWTAFDFETDEG